MPRDGTTCRRCGETDFGDGSAARSDRRAVHGAARRAVQVTRGWRRLLPWRREGARVQECRVQELTDRKNRLVAARREDRSMNPALVRRRGTAIRPCCARLTPCRGSNSCCGVRQHGLCRPGDADRMRTAISQPYVVAYMSEQLEVRPEHRVLEIGTRSGYQAAVLSRLAGQVVFPSSGYRTLADRAPRHAGRLGYDTSRCWRAMGWKACRRTRRTTASWSRRRPRPCRSPRRPARGRWYPAVAARPARWAAAHRAHPDGRGGPRQEELIGVRFVPLLPGRAREL